MSIIDQKHYLLNVELWDLTLTASIHSNIYSAIKYIVRYKRKGRPLEDLEKAITFLTKLEECPDLSIIWAEYNDERLLKEFQRQFKDIEGLIIGRLTQSIFDNYGDIEVIIELIEDLKIEYLKGVRR